ncbi:MAG TPA: hypothetical protein VFQ77_08060 [Pseudonocardiaceae bacterium]|nr:hypothetical protein [Pseudonocardiaceae bacterium]
MTHFVAASAHGSNLTAWVLLGLTGWLVWYLVACAAYPWRTCTWCDGGRKRSASRKHWRDCRHCRGTGRRARAGRRLWRAISNRRD